MSAAATAAGYLYASGRLRGRAAREQEQGPEKKPERPARKEIRVAVMPTREEPTEPTPAPRKTPKIEYRTRRRWSVEPVE
jgi:hypothetical protein